MGKFADSMRKITDKIPEVKGQWWYPTAFQSWGIEEEDAIRRVRDSGRWTMGPEVQTFEQEFAKYHSMNYGIMVNSGSSANLIAVAALFHLPYAPLQHGDKVIVPALAWSTTYAPLVQHGLDLALVDCDDTWNASPEYCCHDDAKLIVGCSILGNPAYLQEWNIAKQQGTLFIEDNCESLGAMLPNLRKCGTIGIMNTFSFFWSHQLSAIEGGMILTNSGECNRLCRMLRAHGWTRDIAKPEGKFEDEYDFQVMGYNVRPLEMHAAIGRAQLEKLPRFLQARWNNFEQFRGLTRSLPIKMPEMRGNPSPFGLQFTVKDRGTRSRLVQALRGAGIDCRLPTGGSFTKHAYGKPWVAQSTPEADRIHDTGMFLGNAPFDISDKIERAVQIMKEAL